MSVILYESGAAYEGDNEALIAYDDHLPDATVTASSEQTGAEIENALDGNTFDFWQPNTTGNVTVDIDLVTAQRADYLAIGAHNLSSELSDDITVAYSADGNTYTTSYTIDDADIVDDGPILLHLVSRTNRYARLTFPVASTDFRIGILQYGTLLQMQRTVYDGLNPPTLSREEEMIPNRSDSGRFLGMLLTRAFFETRLSWDDLEPDWYRQHFDPFVIASQTRGFFLAWRPAEFDAEVVYAWRTRAVRPDNSGEVGLMSVRLDIQGVTP